MKQIKVQIIVPQKAVDDAIKARIKELEAENEDLKDTLKRIRDSVASEN